jgi:nitrite reductase (NADH) small subunit
LLELGRFDEFAEGQIRIVEANGQELGVVKWKGEVYVIRNVCPHQKGPIGRGKVRRRLRCLGPQHEITADDESPVVVCPWHRWEFDLRSGRPIWDPVGPRLAMIRVRVEDGRVMAVVAA